MTLRPTSKHWVRQPFSTVSFNVLIDTWISATSVFTRYSNVFFSFVSLSLMGTCYFEKCLAAVIGFFQL